MFINNIIDDYRQYKLMSIKKTRKMFLIIIKNA